MKQGKTNAAPPAMLKALEFNIPVGGNDHN
jgi:hypothetical protein